jgi:pimeloyl-ACP methyl ester carboxylesterase
MSTYRDSYKNMWQNSTIVVSKSELAFSIIGHLQMPKVFLFLSGFQRPRKDFMAIIQKLSLQNADTCFIALDAPFSGESVVMPANTSKTIETSSTNQDTLLSLEDMAEQIIEAIRIWYPHGIKNSLYVLGISMGGMLSQIIASKLPVQKLFLVSTHTGRGGSANNVLAGENFPALLADPQGVKIFVQKFVSPAFYEKNPTLVRIMEQHLLQADTTQQNNAKQQWVCVLNFDGTQYSTQANNIYILVGNQDAIAYTNGATGKLKNHYSSAEYTEIDGVGHSFLLEAPQLFFEYIQQRLCC